MCSAAAFAFRIAFASNVVPVSIRLGQAELRRRFHRDPERPQKVDDLAHLSLVVARHDDRAGARRIVSRERLQSTASFCRSTSRAMPLPRELQQA